MGVIRSCRRSLKVSRGDGRIDPYAPNWMPTSQAMIKRRGTVNYVLHDFALLARCDRRNVHKMLSVDDSVRLEGLCVVRRFFFDDQHQPSNRRRNKPFSR